MEKKKVAVRINLKVVVLLHAQRCGCSMTWNFHLIGLGQHLQSLVFFAACIQIFITFYPSVREASREVANFIKKKYLLLCLSNTNLTSIISGLVKQNELNFFGRLCQKAIFRQKISSAKGWQGPQPKIDVLSKYLSYVSWD